jgi:tetratricopeptide (TPR) repeat protein
VRWLAAGAVLAFGCAQALRAPAPLPPTSPADAARPAPALLAEAEAAFAHRPDRAAVERARELYLAAAARDPAGVEGLAGVVDVNAWAIEHERDAAARKRLVQDSIDAAQHCKERVPSSAACDYALAIALGQQARERPSTAEEGLRLMFEALTRAAKADPALDRAGPDRLLAILLLRAPGWPLGPGDPEGALPHAKAAAGRFPDWPPNQLALGEALDKNGDEPRALEARRRALELARALAPQNPDAAGWAAEAEKTLR